METIGICKDKDYLKEYLEVRETEVKDIMMMVLSAERALEARIIDAEAAGEARGIAMGEARGAALGEEKKAKETALSMKAKGLSIELIAECIHVDEATVKEWLKAAV